MTQGRRKHIGLSKIRVLLIISILFGAANYAQIAWANENSEPNSVPITESKLVENTASMVEITPALKKASLIPVFEQIDKILEQKPKTIVFRFSGRGGDFETFSELAGKIALLPGEAELRTIAFIPREAKGMAVLGVFACQEIITGELAQIGQVIPPAEILEAENLPVYDSQSVINKLEGLSEISGHDPLLARAMAQKRMILYQIGRDGEKKLVEQADFERFTHQAERPWQMVGPGPLVGGDEVLLLSGRRAKELGLASHLAANKEELAEILGVDFIDTEAQAAEEDKAVDGGKEKDKKRPAYLDLPPKAVIITIEEMVDEGLYESIVRRTEAALAQKTNYIIYEIDTFGGRVDSAIKIYDYFLQDVGSRAHTIAYIPTKAISAGALISVACRDIIMKKATKLGDCAPISMGGTLEGVEREKIETVLRSYFTDAANINGYPAALCRAMVTDKLEVYQVKNLQTDKFEFFEKEVLPRDYPYDVDNARVVVKEGELLTLTADQAFEYGFARKVVEGLDEAALENVLAFLEERDGVQLPRPVAVLETNWSEELVRWIGSPAVAGILMMVALLGIYMELKTPGLGLPGAVAIAALVILFGSKYLHGMANWWEIAVFFIGLGLLILEIFVIPGFGFAGISGAFMMIFALGAMMVTNRPDELPIPASPVDWEIFEDQLTWSAIGFILFVACAYVFGRYLHKIPIANRLVLVAQAESAQVRSGGVAAPAPVWPVMVGQEGISLSQLRPSGNAKFGATRLTVVTRGELVETKRKIKVVALDGNSIVVKEVAGQNDY
jgi:membrane-bound serine protease (ClpP class)